jgi:SET domain-containing protein
MSIDTNTFIDATKQGNIARFVNHGCGPNAEVEKVALFSDSIIYFT